MSLETWIAEYYPVSADECPEGGELQHAKLKYSGLRKASLDKHGMQKMFGRGDHRFAITDGTHCFWVGVTTCASCKRHFPMCRRCKLYGCKWRWKHWRKTGDPEPMIAHIKAAMKKAEATP